MERFTFENSSSSPSILENYKLVSILIKRRKLGKHGYSTTYPQRAEFENAMLSN